jgi:hypothetical protein
MKKSAVSEKGLMSPTISRVGLWLGRAGFALLGVLVYVVWGLLDGLDIYGLIGLPIGLGALVGFLFLVLWLSEKTSGPVVALVYVLALATLGSLLWFTTKHGGVVAFTVVPVSLLGLIFLAAGVAGAKEEARRTARNRSGPDRQREKVMETRESTVPEQRRLSKRERKALRRALTRPYVQTASWPPTLGIFVTALLMLGLSVALLIVCVYLIPFFQRLGIPPDAANRIPFVGLVAGLGWGWRMRTSRRARVAFQELGLPIAAGTIVWGFALRPAAVLSEILGFHTAAEALLRVSFYAGAAVGAAPLIARLLHFFLDRVAPQFRRDSRRSQNVAQEE